MQDLLPKINEYCDQLSTIPDEQLSDIERGTHLKTLAPRMLSGALQGSLLSMISKIKQPKYILEIGTFTGYSAICLATGLGVGGQLITLEYDVEHAAIADTYFKKSRYRDQIQLLTGDAKVIIPTLADGIDLVFIDADKEAYGQYFEMVIGKCNPGALILADNVLWSGKVVQEKMDKKTQSLDLFNRNIFLDARVENVLLPIRDGINVIRKL